MMKAMAVCLLYERIWESQLQIIGCVCRKVLIYSSVEYCFPHAKHNEKDNDDLSMNVFKMKMCEQLYKVLHSAVWTNYVTRRKACFAPGSCPLCQTHIITHHHNWN